MNVKTTMYRDKYIATANHSGPSNRRPRNGEYVGPHSSAYVKRAYELAQKYRRKVPCSSKHFVNPTGLISRKGKVKR